jgi:hypothetical protein
MGLFDRRQDLRLDLLGQVVDVFDTDAAGIDELKVPAFMLDEGPKPISGNTGEVFDDRQTATGKPIED